MAGTLTGKDFWELVQHILPFYIILLISYGFGKKNIIQKIHGPGLNRWTSLVGIPLYVGNMLAFNDPYEINLRLVGADALQKIVVLIVASLWWRFSKYGSIDGVITFFMLATLSNMVLVGPALFQPLHGDSSLVSIATIIILQCALWYNICIILFETRVVLKEMNSTPAIQQKLAIMSEPEEEAHTEILPFEKILGVVPSALDDEIEKFHERLRHGRNSPTRLQRTTSAPARVYSRSLSSARVKPFMQSSTAQVDEQEGDETETISKENKAGQEGSDTVHGHHVEFEVPTKTSTNPEKDAGSVTIDVSEKDNSGVLELQSKEPLKINRMKYVKIVSFKVLNRVKYAPLTYTSMIGFTYSLLAFRYNWEMPYPIKTAVQLVADGAIAISVVTMALTWVDSGRLISCGVRKMTYGFVIRFVLGPVTMALCALAFGLSGIAFEFAVLQAALPVGLVSFVLAKEYGLDVEVFSTAVITQLVVFLPLVTLYYFILQPIGV